MSVLSILWYGCQIELPIWDKCVFSELNFSFQYKIWLKFLNNQAKEVANNCSFLSTTPTNISLRWAAGVYDLH